MGSDKLAATPRSWVEHNGRLLAICEAAGGDARRSGVSRADNPYRRAIPNEQLLALSPDARVAMEEAWWHGWDTTPAEGTGT